MTKKPQQSRYEKASEGFFPADEDDFKITTTKKVKESQPRETIIKTATTKKVKEKVKTETVVKKAISKKYKKPGAKARQKVVKKSTKKKKRATAKKTYSIPKIKLKEKGYELVITEKPQAALKIANALGKAVQKTNKKVPYYEVERNGEKIVVGCAVGHLFTLTQNNAGTTVPNFDISWMPNYISRKRDFSKNYYDTLLTLAKGASGLTVATDFDIEGEVIGLNVVRFICAQQDAKRMKFSTLTEKELNDAYDKRSKTLEWGQALAGETRHHLGWFYGINLSRALMNAIKTTGKFKIMSIGRVQGPSLKLIVDKEKEIKDFISQPYWQSFITVTSPKVELKHNKDIFDKEDLGKFENLIGKTAIANTKKTQNIMPPNPPFNLTTLQTESYKFHGITPKNALRAAQSLYLAGLISYPRTSSQKLPKELGYDKILEILKKIYKVAKLITRKTPIEGKKTDPAHPSIYPTGNKPPILSGDEEKVYELIVKRFLSLFCDDAIVNNKRISATVEDLIYAARGSEIEKKAWMEIYPSKLKEESLPDLEGEVKIIDSKVVEKETQPPKRFSPASILTQLEKKNLGTKATRAAILETLYDRGYVKDKSIEATPLGISLIETLQKHSPIIIDEALTRKFEQQMNSIIENKNQAKTKLKEKEEKIIEEAKKTITQIAKDFEANEEKIGRELTDANTKVYAQQKKRIL